MAPNMEQTQSRVIRQSTGIAEGEYLPCYIEPARIVNVNIDDWSIDAVGEFANKRFFDIQVMSPYFHYANGEGIYCMPEVGAYVWIGFQSTGRMAQPFVLGFKAPFDESNINYRCNRQNLNPGDIMLRTRDENFVILRRGGVLQMGSTPTCQTIYVPIRNIIRQFCENYELNAFGGDLIWSIDRDDQTITGDAPAKLTLRAKEKANDPKHIAELSIGSHGASDPVTLRLVIRDSGLDGAQDMVTMELTKEGSVNWTLKKDLAITVEGNITTTANGDVTTDAAGAHTVSAQKAMLMKSSQDEATVDGMKKATVKSATEVDLDSPLIKVGGSAATSPMVLGDQLITFLGAMITQIASIQQTVPPSTPTTAPTIAAMSAQLPTLLSASVFTKA